MVDEDERKGRKGGIMGKTINTIEMGNQHDQRKKKRKKESTIAGGEEEEDGRNGR